MHWPILQTKASLMEARLESALLLAFGVCRYRKALVLHDALDRYSCRSSLVRPRYRAVVVAIGMVMSSDVLGSGNDTVLVSPKSCAEFPKLLLQTV